MKLKHLKVGQRVSLIIEGVAVARMIERPKGDKGLVMFPQTPLHTTTCPSCRRATSNQASYLIIDKIKKITKLED